MQQVKNISQRDVESLTTANIYQTYCQDPYGDYDEQTDAFSILVMPKKVHEVLKPLHAWLLLDYRGSTTGKRRYGNKPVPIYRDMMQGTYTTTDGKRALIYPGVRLSSNNSSTAPSQSRETPSQRIPDTSDIIISKEQYNQSNDYIREQQCFSYMKRVLGYPAHICAGIIGNMYVESFDRRKWKRYCTSILWDGGKAVWLCQRNGVRKKALIQFANQHSMDPYYYVTQLQFMDYELNNTHTEAKEYVFQTNTVQAATLAFMKHYERPGIPHQSERISQASIAYQEHRHFNEYKSETYSLMA
jgi:hypothetical protein